jgi:hypothetical protein
VHAHAPQFQVCEMRVPAVQHMACPLTGYALKAHAQTHALARLTHTMTRHSVGVHQADSSRGCGQRFWRHRTRPTVARGMLLAHAVRRRSCDWWNVPECRAHVWPHEQHKQYHHHHLCISSLDSVSNRHSTTPAKLATRDDSQGGQGLIIRLACA